MKTSESFAQAVNPELTKTIPSKPIPKEESFEFIVSQTIYILHCFDDDPQTYNWYNYKVQEKTKSSTKSSSKAALKQKLKEALDNMEKYEEHQVMKMIEDAASTKSSSEDNGDMCNPKGLALAYMDPDYE
ncbi:hypothetical protein H5410_023707 [Solanum commersonii]|uniref:Uncharacterized protein n=1 Tax=Solanum commersonii TaxID=4109 RepID=A0A9J5ZI70_SOLCO|nr:hypothetical protein H5410_023707 [Solanum commersonii]